MTTIIFNLLQDGKKSAYSFKQHLKVIASEIGYFVD